MIISSATTSRPRSACFEVSFELAGGLSFEFALLLALLPVFEFALLLLLLWDFDRNLDLATELLALSSGGARSLELLLELFSASFARFSLLFLVCFVILYLMSYCIFSRDLLRSMLSTQADPPNLNDLCFRFAIFICFEKPTC